MSQSGKICAPKVKHSTNAVIHSEHVLLSSQRCNVKKKTIVKWYIILSLCYNLNKPTNV